MDTHQLKEQVGIIRQAFGYINRFKGQTFVIKIDSPLIGHPFFPMLLRDIVLLHQMGIRIVLVPGARTRIDEVLKTYSIRTRTVKGTRISTPRAIPFIKMAAFDVSNRLMTLLAENNTGAIIGNWVRARAIGVRDGVDFKCSGIVDKLKAEPLRTVLAEGLIPIFPNIGWSVKGTPYNISSNDLATTISRELKAAKLFFITEHDGLSARGLTLADDIYVTSTGTISQLTVSQAARLCEAQPGPHRMDPRLELMVHAVRACQSGVYRVHIINGRIEGMILKEIFSNRGLGTMVYGNQHDHIREARHTDIPDLLRIMQPAVEAGQVVARSPKLLQKVVGDFLVYEVDGTIHGCGALHTLTAGQAEIAGLVVDDVYTCLGIGKKLLLALLDKAGQAGCKKVFTLTTHAADLFTQAGFHETSKKELPPGRRSSYNPKRKSRVLVAALSRTPAGLGVE